MQCLQGSKSLLQDARMKYQLQRHHPRQTVLVHCSFSFANSERAAKPTGRRNRYVEKKQEEVLRSVAAGLCNFNGKQLQAVSHLLSEQHLKQIRIGMDIPPTNQGRKRQVGLVMGLLRTDLDEPTLSKLCEAVQQANRYNLPYSDRDVEQQLDVWLEGLVDNDQEVVSEVFALMQDRQQDWQQLRTWVRQLQQQQQHQQEMQQQQPPLAQEVAAAVPVVQPQELASVAVQDPEVLQLIQELNQPQQQQQQEGPSAASSSKKSKGGKSPAASARRSLRRMLKPLALSVL